MPKHEAPDVKLHLKSEAESYAMTLEKVENKAKNCDEHNPR